MLGALAYWGMTIDVGSGARWTAGFGAPAIAVIVWATWLAPRSSRRLEMPWLMVVKLVVFAFAGLALTLAGQLVWGAILVVLAVLNVGLAAYWEQDGVV